MKKKYSIEDIQKHEEPIIEEASGVKASVKTPVVFSKKSKDKKKRRRIIIATVLTIILSIIGYFGFITYRSLNNIFKDGPSLLNLFNAHELKGENSGRVNILLLGVGDKGHNGEGLTDTIMLVSLDTKTNKVSMVSIPRDLYVKLDKYGYGKINSANVYGEQNKYSGGGIGLAKDTVSKVVDQPIHYYAMIDFTGFKKVIDIVGGIDVDVEKDLYDPYYPTNDDKATMVLNIKKGRQHMNGETALRYARSRETTSDFDRAKRQQQILVATRDKVLSTQTVLNPKKVSEIIQALGDHVKTDMQFNEAQKLFDYAKKVDKSTIINKVIDNSADGLLMSGPAEAGYTLIPRLGIGNYKDIQIMVRNVFMSDNLKAEAAKVSVYNGTSVTGVAGRLAEKIKEKGINVIETNTYKNTSQTKTIIYDYTEGKKSSTLNFLTSLTGGIVQRGTSSGNGSDIEIVIGQNYSE